MASDEKDDKWGTIFIDSKRESTLSKLDAMQAASRQEQWNQRTQQDYMEKVRAKAVERAREILGEAYTERQKVLEEAEVEAGEIRAEAINIKNNAEGIRNEAQELRHSVQAELDKALHMQSTAQEDGFQAGLKQAQEELDNFRLNMGSSVAGVLKAIESQTLNIFAAWRVELVSLLKVCVERSTGLALDERYNKILENLVIEAVRNLDDRRHVTLKVHPDDEAVMADIFAAAKEKMPDLGQWAIESDPSLELGGLLAESSSGTVDSRLELFREMVNNILEHLALPENELDSKGLAFVEKISKLEQENIESILPTKTTENASSEHPPTEPTVGENAPASENKKIPEVEAGSVESANQQMPDESSVNSQTSPVEKSAEPNYEPNDEVNDAKAIVEDILPPKAVDTSINNEPTADIELQNDAEIKPELAQKQDGTEPSREELEEELLPLPQDEDISQSASDNHAETKDNI